MLCDRCSFIAIDIRTMCSTTITIVVTVTANTDIMIMINVPAYLIPWTSIVRFSPGEFKPGPKK